MQRRQFIRSVGGCTAGLAMSGRLSGRGGAARAADLGHVAYQFSWVKNFQFAGEYVADSKGYYRQAGIQVELLAGGPSMTVDPVVASGKALIGQSEPDATANANAKGAGLRVIGACYQKSPYCMISLSRTALRSPQDMVGKRIGIQASNRLLWRAFLRINRIDAGSLTTVPVQFDVAPLVSGEVDGFFGYSNDDVVHLRARGVDVAYFLLADHGYRLFTATYTTRADSLVDKTARAQLVAFMRGDIRGWQAVVADPTEAARLTVDVYGSGNGLNEETERQSCLMTNELMVTDTTRRHGLFWMSDAAVAETIATMATGGIHATPDMFTNEILAELYQGHASI